MLRWLTLLSLLGSTLSCGSAPGSVDAGGAESVDVTIFAAASLTDAFTASKAAIPQVRPRFSFAGSQQLVAQLAQGAPADVVATADEESMQRLVDARLVDPPAALARNTLVIAVAPGNPRAVTRLSDLGRPGLAVVLADPSVPAGRATRRVLDAAGVRVSPRSLELDVRATLAKVTSGAADAAVVYATDVRASAGRATAVPFPEASAPEAGVAYRIAVVSGTGHRPAAEAFVAWATGGPGRDALLAAGFEA